MNTGKRATEDELKFLLLYSPDEIAIGGTSVKYNNFALWLEVITRYLKTYPLILTCFFVNQSGKVPYEYALIATIIILSLALALGIFLSEYLLYRYDHDDQADESEE